MSTIEVEFLGGVNDGEKTFFPEPLPRVIIIPVITLGSGFNCVYLLTPENNYQYLRMEEWVE